MLFRIELVERMLTHVYLMPGMAASPRIFERIKLPVKEYEMHWLNWKLPESQESLSHYAKRMAEDVVHDNIVLIGVSFGGILVQEMKKFLKVKKLIIISSIKSHTELPSHMNLARDTSLYKILPTGLLNYLDQIERLPIGHSIRKRIELYKNYMVMNNKLYLDWSIDKVLNWKQDKPDPDLIHIHGDEDFVFPIKNIKNCIIIKGGTHIMILNRYKWFNENLPEILKI